MLLNFFEQAGPLSIMIAGLAVLVAALAVSHVIRLARVDGPPHSRVRSGVDAILFWGSISAAVGMLQSWIGLMRSADVILRADLISPMKVAQGCSEALLATIFGLTVFLLSALLWFAFRTWIRRLESQAGQ